MSILVLSSRPRECTISLYTSARTTVSILTKTLILPDHVAHLIRVRFVVGSEQQHIGEYDTTLYWYAEQPSLPYPSDLVNRLSPHQHGKWFSTCATRNCIPSVYWQCLLGCSPQGYAWIWTLQTQSLCELDERREHCDALCNFAWGCVALLTTDLLSPKM